MKHTGGGAARKMRRVQGSRDCKTPGRSRVNAAAWLTPNGRARGVGRKHPRIVRQKSTEIIGLLPGHCGNISRKSERKSFHSHAGDALISVEGRRIKESTVPYCSTHS